MKNNTYYDNILRKVLTETLEDRADEIMEKLKFNKPGSSFDYVEEGETCEQCGLGEMVEGDCMECGYSKGEMKETRYVTSKGGRFDKEEMPRSRQDMEMTMPGFDMEEYCAQYYDMDPERCQSYYDQKEYNDNKGELDERLYGNQRRIDKNKNGRIDREDFKMLRSRSEMKENSEETKKREKQEKGIKEKDKKKDNPFKTDPNIKEHPKAKVKVKENPKPKVKESVFYKLEYINESALFTEEEIIDIIEGIINEEDNIKKGKSPAGYAAYEKSHKGSGKEEDDYMKELSKKMIDYMKDGSKGKYDMNPKHFPKGNGQLEKMDKKAYVMSDNGQEFLDDYMHPGMEDLVPEEIEYDENWVKDNIKGSSRTGNNPKWANAEETDLGEKIVKKQKAKKFHKAKQIAYRKSKQPVTDGTGENSGSGVNIKLESVNEKQTQKLNEEFDRMKGLIGYDRKTQ